MYKAGSVGPKARWRTWKRPAETCIQPLLSHRQQTVLYSLLSTVNFEAALLQQLFIFKGKLLPGKSFLLHTRAEVLTPAPGQGGPRYFLRAMLQLSKALENSQRKGFISALGWFLICASEVFPTRGEDCSEGGIQMIQGVSVMTALLGTLCSATSPRAVKSQNHCF